MMAQAGATLMTRGRKPEDTAGVVGEGEKTEQTRQAGQLHSDPTRSHPGLATWNLSGARNWQKQG